MKKLFLVLFVLVIMTIPVHAQTWHTTNQVTVAWDACTLASGDPIPAEDTVEYRVYLEKSGESPVAYALTEDTTVIITFTEEGRYLVGVSGQRTPAGESAQEETDICWSDEASCALGGNTFGLVHFEVISTPSGLRVLQ